MSEESWVLVTGANRGIGFATVKALAASGVHVLAGVRDPNEEVKSALAAIQAASQTPIETIQLDLGDSDSIQAAIKSVRGHNALSGLVNNAGITHNALFQLTRMSDVRRVFEVNFFGLFELTQGLVRIMAKNGGGSIVNVVSSAALDGNRGRSAYAASKAAALVATKSLAREVAPHNIRVNAIAPGITDTSMLESMSVDVLREVEEATNLGRRAQPSEVADAIIFLLSPSSSYISGQVLRVDGGMRRWML